MKSIFSSKIQFQSTEIWFETHKVSYFEFNVIEDHKKVCFQNQLAREGHIDLLYGIYSCCAYSLPTPYALQDFPHIISFLRNCNWQ